MEDFEQKETTSTPPVESQVSTPKKTTMSTPVSIIIAGILIALAIVYTKFAPASPSGTNTANNTDTPKSQVDIKNVSIKDSPFIGNANAPVVIALWSDFQCPFCKQFEVTTMKEIDEKYVKTGKVKIVFKDFQFLGKYSKTPGRDDSTTAGLYARAIWELYPEQYFPWREALFNKQDDENGGFGDEASVQELTKTIAGIDAVKVTAQVKSKKIAYQKMLDDDKAEAAKFGINGTPGFILGTQTIAGAVPYEQFQTAIEALLK